MDLWITVFGDRDADALVVEFDLAGISHQDLDEWVGRCMQEAVAQGLPSSPEALDAFHAEALDALSDAAALDALSDAAEEANQGSGVADMVEDMRRALSTPLTPRRLPSAAARALGRTHVWVRKSKRRRPHWRARVLTTKRVWADAFGADTPADLEGRFVEPGMSRAYVAYQIRLEVYAGYHPDITTGKQDADLARVVQEIIDAIV